MKCEEIFVALAMLEKERGIPQTFMMGKIIQALTTAYKRDHEPSCPQLRKNPRDNV